MDDSSRPNARRTPLTPDARRTALCALVAGGFLTSMPGRWTTPVVESVVLPAHAQTTVDSTPPAGEATEPDADDPAPSCTNTTRIARFDTPGEFEFFVPDGAISVDIELLGGGGGGGGGGWARLVIGQIGGPATRNEGGRGGSGSAGERVQASGAAVLVGFRIDITVGDGGTGGGAGGAQDSGGSGGAGGSGEPNGEGGDGSGSSANGKGGGGGGAGGTSVVGGPGLGGSTFQAAGGTGGGGGGGAYLVRSDGSSGTILQGATGGNGNDGLNGGAGGAGDGTDASDGGDGGSGFNAGRTATGATGGTRGARGGGTFNDLPTSGGTGAPGSVVLTFTVCE